MSIMNANYDMFFEVFSLYITTLRNNKKARGVISFLLSLLLVSSIILRIMSNHWFNEKILDDVNLLFLGLITLFSFFLILTLFSYTKIKINSNRLFFDLSGLRKEREELKKKITKKQDDIFNTIQLSLNQLNEYYTINLDQARSSYRWSIIAILVGLLTLTAGIWFFFFDSDPKIDIAIISGISGIIIEFIGASNIYIYNKSLSQLNLYFNELIKIQNTMLAIELCDKVDDKERKYQITEKIILTLMERE